MAAGQVTSGNELNSYQGNSNLATGDAYGYAKIDLSPLQTFALKKYQNNLIDYQQQQEDRALLQKQFADPAIYQNVDKTLADQLSPSMVRLKELAKKNLYKNPDSKEWYEFQDLYRENLNKNAQAKAVQKIKDDTKEALGKTADPHEKESLTAYVNQLESYKLGDDIPVYNKYFAPVKKYMPKLVTSEMTKEIGLPDGGIRTVKTTVLNPLGGAALAQRILVESPESFQTYKAIAHTTLESGDFDFINEKAGEAYRNGMLLNNSELRNKYQDEYKRFSKENPTSTFRDFMKANGKEGELVAIEKGHEYLKGERGALYEVPAESGKELAGYTYYTKSDGKKVRLNKPDYEVAAIYEATEKPVGAKEEIVSEKLSTKPGEIALKAAQVQATKSLAGLRNEQVRTQKSIQEKNRAAASKLYRQTEVINPLPPTEVPLIGREAKLNKQYQFMIPVSSIPETLRKKAGFSVMPTPPKANASKEEVAKYEEELNNAKNGTYQMRFFTSDGVDVSPKVAAKVSSNKAKLNDFLNSASASGILIKFIDQKGKVVGTTESIDRQTLIENNKTNTKGESVLGVDLEPESTSDE